MKTIESLRQPDFEAIAPMRAADEIEAQIRDLIAKGQLRPGDKLPPERDLAQRFNVSRNTLREALRALEQAKLIELRKGAHGGAFVLHGDAGTVANSMRDLYRLGAITPQQLTDARIWLSKVIVEVACEMATTDDLLRLQANVDATIAADARGDFDERARLNREFHLVLASITRNPIIESAMRGVMGILADFIQQIGPSDNAFIIPSRRRLLKHLNARDTLAATAEMKKSLVRLHDQYLAQWTARQAQTSDARR
ncbi:MAG: GntR family transcriptional regulator [Hydrogenophaga sp.]|uniref:FadR/GntR family transcriptional regulator n=1 Tax=Hydrogenophaga sp. TaxID=1904254 RepID=UPI002727EBD9|nr:GntR family transcriptional regulator [Hydrogenophaga sp.]MDO9570602.1 GntR family transcriptional regulator [Hydrogenophaga sp.]MDP3376302.1 GntR family transcriptional regulator [Hydrogenophaga sp.]